MKPLRKPMSGLGFGVWIMYFHINLARDFTWAEDVEGKRRTYIFDLSIIQMEEMHALCLTILPLKIMVGINLN